MFLSGFLEGLWWSKPLWDPILVGIGEFTISEPVLVGDWDVHWGEGILTHGQWPHEK